MFLIALKSSEIFKSIFVLRHNRERRRLLSELYLDKYRIFFFGLAWQIRRLSRLQIQRYRYRYASVICLGKKDTDLRAPDFGGSHKNIRKLRLRKKSLLPRGWNSLG